MLQVGSIAYEFLACRLAIVFSIQSEILNGPGSSVYSVFIKCNGAFLLAPLSFMKFTLCNHRALCIHSPATSLLFYFNSFIVVRCLAIDVCSIIPTGCPCNFPCNSIFKKLKRCSLYNQVNF
uniref:Uncharacterized protein n=1 Tax=Rhipicephalus microplus TaxID=6941 RepID=A0A6G5AFV8_RHIMP